MTKSPEAILADLAPLAAGKKRVYGLPLHCKSGAGLGTGIGLQLYIRSLYAR